MMHENILIVSDFVWFHPDIAFHEIKGYLLYDFTEVDYSELNNQFTASWFRLSWGDIGCETNHYL